MYGNRVNTLPHEIAHLKKLKKLALNENLLSDLPGNRTGIYEECDCGLWGELMYYFYYYVL